MSGPLSSNEIEDVVSSVRRLVSTDNRPRVVSRDLGGDKLILTPALRVVADNAAAPDPLILTGENLAFDPATDEVEMMPGVAGDDRLHLVEAEWEDEIWSAPEAPLAELALGAEEAEVVVAEVTPEPVPEELATAALWPESVEDEAPWTEAETEWAEEPPIPMTTFVAPEPEPEPVAESSVAPVAPVLTLVETVVDAPDESLVAEPAQLAEVDQGASDADNEIDVAGVLTAALVEDEEFRVMEEAELHELVRAMVREELQGNLGERITRNVRKLVRAEINRALAARALD